MTDIEKAEQAWKIESFKSDDPMSFIMGMRGLKSSLQREIEKRIEELQESLKNENSLLEAAYTHNRIFECKKFLELLNTVEP